jgi:hypothetical protein
MTSRRLDVAITESRITLAGRLDDTSQLGDVPARVPAGDVAIDTDGVTFVNSIGMREWMRLIRALRERGRVTLERVADVLMTQMNLIPEFTGSVAIASFHAQYACNSCGAEAAPLVDAVVHAPTLRAMKAPLLPCPECGAAMELGDFPERYLSIFRPSA